MNIFFIVVALLIGIFAARYCIRFRNNIIERAEFHYACFGQLHAFLAMATGGNVPGKSFQPGRV